VNLDLVHLEYDVSGFSPQFARTLYGSLHRFAEYFRRECCALSAESCLACAVLACPYRQVFAQLLSPDPDVVRVHQKPSLPFSLSINMFDGKFSQFTLGLVVVGAAVNLIQLFHEAVMAMLGELAAEQFFLGDKTIRAYALDYLKERHEFELPTTLSAHVILLSARHILEDALHAGHIRLTFATPLRLTVNGAVLSRFDYATFFRAQLRRCSSLWAYYGSGAPALDFVALSTAADTVSILENTMYYGRRPGYGPQGKPGLMGVVECDGLAEPMFALLQLGSYFNAGKGASYGAGFYQLEAL
jgi:hypothetical protein